VTLLSLSKHPKGDGALVSGTPILQLSGWLIQAGLACAFHFIDSQMPSL
jgi:hypothetical protein